MKMLRHYLTKSENMDILVFWANMKNDGRSIAYTKWHLPNRISTKRACKICYLLGLLGK